MFDGRWCTSSLKTLQPDFKNRMYIDAYHSIFSGTGTHFHDTGNSISREDYPEGYCFFAFDLTPDLSANENSHWNVAQNGNIRIEVRFSEELKSVINALIFCEYENLLEIDSSRQILVDYSG